jgi:hypothetical protein
MTGVLAFLITNQQMLNGIKVGGRVVKVADNSDVVGSRPGTTAEIF